jgi:hypothetical protein
MKSALMTLVGTFCFLTATIIILCVIITIIQAIFNSEARNDWMHVFYYFRYKFTKIKKCVTINSKLFFRRKRLKHVV